MPNRHWKADLIRYFPDGLRPVIARVEAFAPLTEIRVRVHRPIQMVFAGYERLMGGSEGLPLPVEEDVAHIVSAACEGSLYAFEEELAAGFVTLPGGYRMGVTGRCVQSLAGKSRLLDFTGLTIRICRAYPGAAAPLIPLLADGRGKPVSALIVSPPGCGKTTLLRDIARLFSLGEKGAKPTRVALVDTRYELAGCLRGAPAFELGPRTDLRSGGDKAEGIRAMVRSMCPELIVTDEIGSLSDASAILDAASSGVAVIASAHGAALTDLARRPAIAELVRQRAFARYILLSGLAAPGTLEAAYLSDGKRLELGEGQWQKRLRC